MMGAMEQNWVRLGKELAAGRVRMHLTQLQIADLIGASESTVQDIEAGKPYKKPTRSQRAYAQAIGWTHASVDNVLADGEHEMAPAAPAPHAKPASRAADTGIGIITLPQPGLPLVVQQELARGTTVRVQLEWTNEGGRDRRRFVIEQEVPDGPDANDTPGAGNDS
jgi:DNA-binding XRE family transcriptional regulator